MGLLLKGSHRMLFLPATLGLTLTHVDGLRGFFLSYLNPIGAVQVNLPTFESSVSWSRTLQESISRAPQLRLLALTS